MKFWISEDPPTEILLGKLKLIQIFNDFFYLPGMQIKQIIEALCSIYEFILNMTPVNITEIYTFVVEQQLQRFPEISNSQVKIISSALGCPSDKKSGMIIHRKAGEFVKKGEVIMELFSSRENALDAAIQQVQIKSPFKQEGMVLERIGSGSISLNRV